MLSIENSNHSSQDTSSPSHTTIELPIFSQKSSSTKYNYYHICTAATIGNTRIFPFLFHSVRTDCELFANKLRTNCERNKKTIPTCGYSLYVLQIFNYNIIPSSCYASLNTSPCVAFTYSSSKRSSWSHESTDFNAC